MSKETSQHFAVAVTQALLLVKKKYNLPDQALKDFTEEMNRVLGLIEIKNVPTSNNRRKKI